MKVPLAILTSIIRPAIRFCIRYNVTIQGLTEAMKKVFIEEAARALTKAGESISASRINIMTGVHRIDIARLQQGDVKGEQNKILVKVIGYWQAKYSSKSGRPRVLSNTGVDSEFFQMVQEVGKDLNPYTVLFELERLGLAEKTGSGIRLKKTQLVLDKNLEEGLQVYAQDSSDLLSAVEENILQFPPYAARHHLRTEYDAINSDDIPKVRKWIHKEGEKIHARARTCFSKYDVDQNGRTKDADDKKFRVVFTSYAYIEPISEPEDEDS